MTNFLRNCLLGVSAAVLLAGCSMIFATSETHPATWRLAHPVTAESTTVDLLILESVCSGGSSPAGRILDPSIAYTQTAITIAVDVRLASSLAAGCPMNPEYPLTVALSEPVGTRAITGVSGQNGFEPGPTRPPR